MKTITQTRSPRRVKMPWFVWPRIRQQADGRLSLRMEFNCEVERPRPSWWARLPAVLEAHGFALERDFDGSVEMFTPVSFRSAFAVIVGTRVFAADETDAMHETVSRMIVDLSIESVLEPRS